MSKDFSTLRVIGVPREVKDRSTAKNSILTFFFAAVLDDLLIRRASSQIEKIPM
jgi:hypothetical protein